MSEEMLTTETGVSIGVKSFTLRVCKVSDKYTGALKYYCFAGLRRSQIQRCQYLRFIEEYGTEVAYGLRFVKIPEWLC